MCFIYVQYSISLGAEIKKEARDTQDLETREVCYILVQLEKRVAAAVAAVLACRHSAHTQVVLQS